MYRLIYVSTAADGIADGDVTSIVGTARKNNGPLGITGLLLFNGLNFMQLLEGERRDVEDVYSRILADRRHISVNTMLQEPADAWLYPDWSMAYRFVRTPDPDGRAAQDTDTPVAAEMPDHVRKLIDGFDTLMGI